MTKPLVPVIVDDRGELQTIATRLMWEFIHDYDEQGVETGSLTRDMEGRETPAEVVVVLLPSADGVEYIGALWLDLGVDRWDLDWAYLQPAHRHQGLIERWWPDVSDLLLERGWPDIGYGAMEIRHFGERSPAGESLIRRLGIGWEPE